MQTPPRRRTGLIVTLIVVPVVLIVAVAGAGAFLLVRVMSDNTSLPAGWRTAGFVVPTTDDSVRDNVGRLLIARVGGEARYVLRPRGALIGVPVSERANLDRLVAELPLQASVSLRPVLEGTGGDQLRSLDGKTTYNLGPAVLTGERITAASYEADKNGPGWTIQMTFDSAGTQQLAAATSQLQGKQLAIVAAGVVISAPEVQQAITGGALQISGKFTQNEASGIVAAFQLGRHPVQITAGDPG